MRRQKELAKAAKRAGLDLTETLPIGPKTLSLVGSQRLHDAIARTAAATAILCLMLGMPLVGRVSICLVLRPI